jgi:Fe-S-cluster containining protein
MALDELDYNKEDFKTLDITRLTPLSRVLSMISESQRPGNACTFTSGLIHEDELHSIATHLDVSKEQLENNLLEKHDVYNKKMHRPKVVKQKGKEHLPYGSCIFLDKDQEGHVCKLDENKPLHCKLSTGNKLGHKLHIWYLLKYVIDPKDPESLRQWSIYLKSHPTIPGGELHELEPNSDILRKILSYEIFK